MEALQILSRSEMRTIRGGYIQTGCTLYCCEEGDLNDCSEGTSCSACGDDCLSSAIALGYSCDEGVLIEK